MFRTYTLFRSPIKDTLIPLFIKASIICSKLAIAKAGIVPGAHVITGGITNCSPKVVASWGGVSYILVSNTSRAIDFFMAGFKD